MIHSSALESLSDLVDPEIQSILFELAKSGAWAVYEGPFLQALSESLQSRFQRKYVHLCCSGTLAIELALRGLRIGEGDEVLLASYDFPGNFRAIEAVGASVAIVDIPANQWSLNRVDELDRAFKPNTKALIVSHLHGTLASMKAISEWARAKGIGLVEDACQAPGASVDGRPVGSWGDCSVLSFGGSKLLSAGRGGAVLTDDPRIDQRIRIYRDRGNDAFPLSELQAAVLGPQLRMLDQRQLQRAAIVESLEKKSASWRWLAIPDREIPIGNCAFYKWGFQVNPSQAPVDEFRDTVIRLLQEKGLLVGKGFHGFANRSSTRCRRIGPLTNAARAAMTTVLIHHTNLQPALIDQLDSVDQQLRESQAW